LPRLGSIKTGKLGSAPENLRLRAAGHCCISEINS